MAGERILMIEDDAAVTLAVRISLEGYGFAVRTASTGQAGYALAVGAAAPQVVLLDLGLPDVDGLDVCTRIRAHSQVPIIVLTARDAEHAKITALEGGADDYVTKPFGIGELLARIRVALRHGAQRAPVAVPPRLYVGELVVDSGAHQVWVRGAAVHLTPTEFKLLEILVRQAGRLVTHRLLLREVWGSGYDTDTQVLRVFIAQLRDKLEVNAADPQYIVTEPGVGYRFAPLNEG